MIDETGERIKQARIARGMSQAELAKLVGVSNSYLSHIEAGRRPVSSTIRLQIAAALKVESKQLEDGVPADAKEELRLKLGFAEMALRNGNWALGKSTFEEALTAAQKMPLDRFVDEARWGVARSLEATGDLEGAIVEYEALRASPTLSAGISRSATCVALVRAYRESGDLGRAIDVGESELARLGSELTEQSEQPVELMSSLAGCYIERGDLTRAHLLCRQALDVAERLGSMRDRAAAAWEAAAVAESRHEMVAARRHADRALALYEELDSQRAVAMLRVVTAALLLRQDSPEPSQAVDLLQRAFAELLEVGNDVDLAYVRTEEARALLLSGAVDRASETVSSALQSLSEGDKLQRGRMLLLQGHIRRAEGKSSEALTTFQMAADHLRQVGAVRQAASAWRELGEVYVELGRAEDAIDALRLASELVGVRHAPHSLAAVGHAVRK